MPSLTDFKTSRICTLDCFLANAKSIVNKMNELEEYVFEYNPGVNMRSESWSRDSISNVELNFNCFHLLRSDRLFSKVGECHVKKYSIKLLLWMT